MNNWTKLTIEEKLTILSNVAESKGIVVFGIHHC